LQELTAGGQPVLEEREFSRTPLTAAEIREIAGSRSPIDLMNPERPVYKEQGFDRRRPTEDEAVEAMAADNNLIYRPIVIRGEKMVKGFDEAAIRELAAA
jgi:arsenate reductase-like glutaredoxin family protein